MYEPNLNPGWIWARLSDAVFEYRDRHGRFPALIRVDPTTYLAMARAAGLPRPTVAGVPVQPDSDLPVGEYLLDRTIRATNRL